MCLFKRIKLETQALLVLFQSREALSSLTEASLLFVY